MVNANMVREKGEINMSTADTPIEIVENFVGALEASSQEEAGSYLDDTFTFSGWTPQPLDKQSFLSLITRLKEGIPGLVFNLQNLTQQEDTSVTASMQITGYQTDNFLMASHGVPSPSQSTDSITTRPEDVSFTLHQGHISAMHVHNAPKGGIQDLFHQTRIDGTTV